MVMNFSERCRSFRKDGSGNFAITTAILLPVLIGGAGVAIDVSNMMVSRNQLQAATDAAALATATALTDGSTDTTAAPQMAKDFVAGQMGNYATLDTATSAAIKAGTTANITQTTSATGVAYAVTVKTSYTMAVTGFTAVLGWKNVQVGASSSTTSGTTQTRTALSMILALDESASMGDNTDVSSQVCVIPLGTKCLLYTTVYVTKIAALKQAAGTLFDTLENADPSHSLVRTGAISYNSAVVGQTKNPTMDWGTTAARKYVTAMPTKPTGGTDASGAMTIADTAVKKSPSGNDNETIMQAQKNNTTSDRFIILMTDGEMTGTGLVWNKTIDQSVRDKCAAAKADGITIFSVAFMAPDSGKALLQYCASSSSDYYEPDTMDKLVNAFKSIAQTATRSLTLLTN